jgi:hypothetical protein
MIMPVPALRAWRLGTALALGAGLVATASVSAERLPFRGAFGAVAENGCKSYREQAEGHYIETYGNGRGYSATGECGCDVTRVRNTGPSAYRLSTICRCNDAPTPQPEEATVVVTSPREIRIDGRRYLRCK